MKIYLFLFVVLISLRTFSQNEINPAFQEMIESQYDFPTISQDEAEEKIKSSQSYFLDTREWKEYATSHIPGAIFTGYDNFMWKSLNTINKDAEIIVYCSIGVRSQNIGKKLVEKGYTNVKNLYGGVFLWADQARALENCNSEPTNKVHGYNTFWGKWVEKAETVYE